MDYKLDYITRLFATISKKKIESYVINRLWHQLDDVRIKFIVQQYIKRGHNNYALADLYLPQINLFIEINEPFHKNNKEIDAIRNEEISRITDSKLVLIDCDTDIENLHKQISDTVLLIRNLINEKGGKFYSWDGENSLSVEYHQKKGYLSVEDVVYVRTIDDAFEIFGTKAKHRGFLRVGGANIPFKDNISVWCPNSGHRLWNNELSNDGSTITEYHCKNEQARKTHVEKWTNTFQHRVTFFREEDELGFRFYRFVGVFEINKEKSLEENKCIWERITDYYKLWLNGQM